MPIKITPSPALDALTLSGDISRTIPLPAGSRQGAVAIALSDGTLLEMIPQAPQGHSFQITKDGAGIVQALGNAVEVQWPIEWLTVSGPGQVLTIDRQPQPLPLFPEAA